MKIVIEKIVLNYFYTPILDIKVKEPTLESLCKKKREYLPPKFMSCAEAADQLLQIVAKKRRGAENINDKDLAYNESSLCIGVARVGHETQSIVVCKLKEMINKNMGEPLHSLVLPAKNLHELELQYLQQFSEEKLIN